MAIKKAVEGTGTESENAVPNAAELAAITEQGGALERVGADDVGLGSFGGDTGDVRLKLPYLQVASGQGVLEKYIKGSIVIGSENLVAGPTEPIRITILQARTFWKEYVSGEAYDPKRILKTFATKAEVVAAGGTTDWVKGQPPPSYKIAIAANVLVQQPKGIVCGLFGVPLGGEMYAPVKWNPDKTAADTVAPVIKTDTTFSLRNRGLHSGIYELRTKQVEFKNGHKTFVPNIVLVGHHTDEVVTQIKELFSAEISKPVDIAPEAADIPANPPVATGTL